MLTQPHCNRFGNGLGHTLCDAVDYRHRDVNEFGHSHHHGHRNALSIALYHGDE